MADIAGQVFKLTLQLEVVHNREHGLKQVLARGVIRPVGRARRRLLVLDVFGTHRRANEDEIVVEVRAVQDAAGDRVEEGLSQFGLVMIDQQADVVEFDLVPHVHGQVAGLELLFQPHRAFLDAQVIELDPFTLGPLLAMPVGCFETVLGTRRLGAKQAVMSVKTVHHRFRDVIGLG